MADKELMKEIPITEKETKIANEEAMYLYGYLRKKYCNESVKDLDIIMNSLCFALLRMTNMHVDSKDRKFFIEQIVVQILRKGIE